MNVFVQLFSIFIFLTIGSLLMIVSLHILSMDDAIFKIREVYANPWQSIQAGLIGLLFILVGLASTRILVKKGRESEALILQGELGPIVVSVNAIEDVVKKVLRKFHLVKDSKIKTTIHGKDVEIRLRLILWSGGRVAELLASIQDDIQARVGKMLGADNKLSVSCDVSRVEDHEQDSEPYENEGNELLQNLK